MKFGMRRPSWRGSMSARTSPSRYVRHSLGWKMPRGWGWISNPRRAAYNRMYHRATFPWMRLFARGGRRRSGCALGLAVWGVLWLLASGSAALAGWYALAN